MEIYKFTLGWDQLDRVPEDERLLALMLGKLLNDINILGKLLSWVQIDDNEIDVERHGRAAQAFLLLTIFAGKLIEGWDLLGVQYFGKQLSRKYHSLIGAKGQETIDALKAYFSQENPLRTVRRQHSFHYDPALVKEDYANVPREEPSDFFSSVPPPLSLFQVSEAVASGAVLRKLGGGNGSEGMNTLVLDSLRISGLFQMFIGAFMTAFLRLNWPDTPKETKIDPGKRPSMDSMSLPFLVE